MKLKEIGRIELDKNTGPHNVTFYNTENQIHREDGPAVIWAGPYPYVSYWLKGHCNKVGYSET